MGLQGPEPVQRIRQFPAMTAIRGIAAWWVVLFHIGDDLHPILPDRLWSFAKDGNLAVDLFFVLSGFVIALNYAQMFSSVTWANCRRFWALRLARIYPLHIFMLTLFLANPIAIGLFSHGQDFGGRYQPDYWLLSVLLMQNWGFTDVLAWNPPAWSISTEWAAYLLFPMWIWLTAGVLRNGWRAAGGAILLMGVLAGITYATVGNLGDEITRLGLVRCVLEFATGTCLFYLWRATGDAPRLAADLLAIAALGLMASHFALGVPDYLAFPAAFFLLIFSLTNDRAVLVRLLSVRPLIWLGTISYSTYLCHYFIKDWAKFVLFQHDIPLGLSALAYFVITLAASAALYKAVELPGRNALRAWTLGSRSRAVSYPARQWSVASRDLEPPR